MHVQVDFTSAAHRHRTAYTPASRTQNITFVLHTLLARKHSTSTLYYLRSCPTNAAHQPRTASAPASHIQHITLTTNLPHKCSTSPSSCTRYLLTTATLHNRSAHATATSVCITSLSYCTCYWNLRMQSFNLVLYTLLRQMSDHFSIVLRKLRKSNVCSTSTH